MTEPWMNWPCPWCNVYAGEKCVTRTTRRELDKPHLKRLKPPPWARVYHDDGCGSFNIDEGTVPWVDTEVDCEPLHVRVHRPEPAPDHLWHTVAAVAGLLILLVAACWIVGFFLGRS